MTKTISRLAEWVHRVSGLETERSDATPASDRSPRPEGAPGAGLRADAGPFTHALLSMPMM